MQPLFRITHVYFNTLFRESTCNLQTKCAIISTDTITKGIAEKQNTPRNGNGRGPPPSPKNADPNLLYKAFPQKLYPALSPHRRRMLRSRLRTVSSCQGRNHIGEQTDLHKQNPNPSPHKSFAELFQKRPFPRSPRSPFYINANQGYGSAKKR